MSKQSPENFPDVGLLMQLAQENPEELEALRDRLNEQLTESAPAHLQPRLRGLLFQIDAKRKLAKTPMQSCIGVYEMMHDSLLELQTGLSGLSGAEPEEERVPKAKAQGKPTPSLEPIAKKTAVVLKFPVMETEA
jgi:hypothetical protein